MADESTNVMSSENGMSSDPTEKLPEDAKNIFRAALDSATRDGMDQDAALKVAWTTIKADYESGSDGQWHRKPREGQGIYNKPSQSGGN